MRLLFDLLHLRNPSCLAPELSTRRPVYRPLEPSQSAEDRGRRNWETSNAGRTHETEEGVSQKTLGVIQRELQFGESLLRFPCGDCICSYRVLGRQLAAPGNGRISICQQPHCKNTCCRPGWTVTTRYWHVHLSTIYHSWNHLMIVWAWWHAPPSSMSTLAIHLS